MNQYSLETNYPENEFFLMISQAFEICLIKLNTVDIKSCTLVLISLNSSVLTSPLHIYIINSLSSILSPVTLNILSENPHLSIFAYKYDS